MTEPIEAALAATSADERADVARSRIHRDERSLRRLGDAAAGVLCLAAHHRGLAQHRTETTVRDCLAQADSLANPLHNLVGNFVCALCAAREDVVDVGFVV